MVSQVYKPAGIASDMRSLYSTISISQFLEFVNRNFPSILPKNVLEHFGHETRPSGVFDNDIRYSLSETEAGKDGSDMRIEPKDIEVIRSIERKSINKFSSEDIKKTDKWARKFFRELGTKSPFFRAWFGDGRAMDTGKVGKTQVTNLDIAEALSIMQKGAVQNTDSGWNINVGSLGAGDTVSHSGREKVSAKMLAEIKHIIENAVLLDTEVSERDSRKKHIETEWMHKLYAYVEYNRKPYIAKISVEEYGTSENAGKRFYNLRGIKIEPVGGAPNTNVSYGTVPDTDSTISISDLFALVKKYDKEFKPKDVNSLLLNDDGTPKDLTLSLNPDKSSISSSITVQMVLATIPWLIRITLQR